MTQRKNYMGMLVVNHYTSDKLETLAGSQLPSPNITEIGIYEASLSDDGHIEKGELISNIIMSDLQFGEMISNPNNESGVQGTLKSMSGYVIGDIDDIDDPAKNLLSNEINDLLTGGVDNQVARFIKETSAVVDKVVENGRIRIGDKSEILKYLGMMRGYVKGNENCAFNTVNEHAEKRVNEVKNTIHNTVRGAYKIGQKTMIEDLIGKDNFEKTSPVCFIGVNVGGSSSEGLFDDINFSARIVSLNIKGSRIGPRFSKGGNNFFSPSKQYLSVRMSPEQYSRVVRADSVGVPCTITRRIGMDIDSVEIEDTREVNLYDDGVINEIREYNDYVIAIEAIFEKVKENQYRGKAGLKALAEDFEKIPSLYKNYLDSTSELKEDKVRSLLSGHQDRIARYAHDELKLLPEESKEKVKGLMANMMTKFKLIR